MVFYFCLKELFLPIEELYCHRKCAYFLVHIFEFSCPLVSAGDWFQDPPEILKFFGAHIPYIKWGIFAYNLYLHVGYSWVCLHITSFAWIQ